MSFSLSENDIVSVSAKMQNSIHRKDMRESAKDGFNANTNRIKQTHTPDHIFGYFSSE